MRRSSRLQKTTYEEIVRILQGESPIHSFLADGSTLLESIERDPCQGYYEVKKDLLDSIKKILGDFLSNREYTTESRLSEIIQIHRMLNFHQPNSARDLNQTLTPEQLYNLEESARTAVQMAQIIQWVLMHSSLSASLTVSFICKSCSALRFLGLCL